MPQNMGLIQVLLGYAMNCYSRNDGSASCVGNNIIDNDSSQAVVTAWLDNLNGIAGRGSEIKLPRVGHVPVLY